MSDSIWGVPNWVYPPKWETTNGEDVPSKKIKYKYYCSYNHVWVDTGMRKVFCKYCDADGEYDPMTGETKVIYKEEDKYEKGEN